MSKADNSINTGSFLLRSGGKAATILKFEKQVFNEMIFSYVC